MMGKGINDRFPFHIIFISLFPILAFYAHNLTEIQFSASFRLIFIILVAMFVLLGFVWLLLRDIRKTGYVVSLFMLLFLSYGHVYGFLKEVTVFGYLIGRHRFLIVVYFVFFIIGMRWLKNQQDLAKLTRNINCFGFILFLIPILQIIYLEFRFRTSNVLSNPSYDMISVDQNIADYHDIYYIIPDSYTRDDTMLSFYEYDNTPFIDALKERGFYIARCSQSNYSFTDLAMASSYNLNYIQEIYFAKDSIGLAKLGRDNLVRAILTNAGYKIVAFDNGYRPTQWYDADVYYSYRTDTGGYISRGLTEFESMFLKTTAGRILLDIDSVARKDIIKIAKNDPMRDRYEYIKYTLDKLTTVPSIMGPKFVYIHIQLPHAPYIFSQSGDFIPEPQPHIPGYRDQVIFINDQILKFVDKILSFSEREPIIIIQGDHGGQETKGFSGGVHILNAYYLPDGGDVGLYSTISPVNTFRLIFNTYFGTNYEYLPDISYRTIGQNLFDFEVVPNTRVDCDP
jgi:hypothetical protein